MWAGLIQTVEGLKSPDEHFLEKKDLSLRTWTWKSCLSFRPAGLPYGLQTQDCNMDNVFESSACPATWEILDLPGPWLCKLFFEVSLTLYPQIWLIFPKLRYVPTALTCSGKSYNDRLTLDFNMAVYLIGRKEIALFPSAKEQERSFRSNPIQ